jgi:hypothetical protein
LYPGPTALVLSVVQKKDAEPYIRVEGVTDEFCRLQHAGSAMARMNATVVSGEIGDANAVWEDIDVNKNSNNNKPGDGKAPSEAASEKSADSRKRKSNSNSTTTKGKKRAKNSTK